MPAKLDARIELRVTRAEKLAFKERARAAGLDVSEYIRKRMLADRASTTPAPATAQSAPRDSTDADTSP